QVPANAFPFLQGQSIRLEQRPDLSRAPVEYLFEHRQHDAEGAVTQDAALGNLGEVLVLGDADGESVPIVDVEHHVDVRPTVPDVNGAIGSDPQAGLDLFERRDLAVPRRNVHDGSDLTCL